MTIISQVPGDLMTVAECGEALGRGRNSVTLFITREGLPAVRLGGRFFVRRADLTEWASRPEIRVMLQAGDRVKGRAGARRRQAV